MTKRNTYIAISLTIVAVILIGFSSMGMMNGWGWIPNEAFYRGVTTTSSGAPEITQKSFASRIDGYNMMDLSIAPSPEAPTAGSTAAEVDQKIIKTGYLDLQVNDVSESVSKISTYTNGNGGFVQDSDISEREDGTHFGNMTVRLPSETFDAAMDEIASYATLVQTRSSQGQDVTEQYTDLEARLGNAQAQEQEYLKILKQATSVEDILSVQQYLGQVRQEIESYQGQVKYLSNQTSYSTITIGLSESSAVHLPTKAFRPFDTLKDAVQGLGAIAQRLVEGLIYLVIIGGGIVLPIGLIVWGIRTLIRRRKQM